MKGKGRSIEADFHAAFAAFDREQQQLESQRSRIEEVSTTVKEQELGGLEEAFASQSLNDKEAVSEDLSWMEPYQQ